MYRIGEQLVIYIGQILGMVEIEIIMRVFRFFRLYTHQHGEQLFALFFIGHSRDRVFEGLQIAFRPHLKARFVQAIVAFEVYYLRHYRLSLYKGTLDVRLFYHKQ